MASSIINLYKVVCVMVIAFATFYKEDHWSGAYGSFSLFYDKEPLSDDLETGNYR